MFVDAAKSETEFGEDDLDQVQKLLVSAARDCVPQDRNSFVEFQSNTGVEVTNSWLISKLNDGIWLHSCLYYLHELCFPVIRVTYCISLRENLVKLRHNYNPMSCAYTVLGWILVESSFEVLKPNQCVKFIFLKKSVLYQVLCSQFSLKFHIAFLKIKRLLVPKRVN